MTFEGQVSSGLYHPVVGIPPGVMVPYQLGLPSVKAEILGMIRDGEQYMLRIEYETLDIHDKLMTVRKEFQRDRKFIEGLYQDYC